VLFQSTFANSNATSSMSHSTRRLLAMTRRGYRTIAPPHICSIAPPSPTLNAMGQISVREGERPTSTPLAAEAEQ